MIIHQPEITQQNGETNLWARIETAGQYQKFPKYLWYRTPNQFSEHLSTHSDAFLLPALQAAMHFGEDLQVRGKVSPRLAYHLDEFQFLQSLQFPTALQQVDIQIEQLAPLAAAPAAVGASFSGGVDSLFTLYKHLPENQPLADYQATHALFINGFNLTQNDQAKYKRLFALYQPLLAESGITLLPLETNLVSSVVHWLELRKFYSPVLLGCVHAFGHIFKRFIISNSRDYSQPAVASTPLADRMLSTEKLDLLYWGSTTHREDKIEAISKWPLAQQALRVCLIPDVEGMNCSGCEKCVRSMLPLYALGVMENFQTFPEPLKSNRDILRLARKFDPFSDHTPTNIDFFRRHKPSMIPWLRVAAILGGVRFWLLQLLPGFIKGWLQRYGFFVSKFQQPNAFDNPEVIHSLDAHKL